YAREMHDLGYQLSLDEAIKARDHGIDPKYAREMDEAGFGKLSMDMMIKARDHGVSSNYPSQLKALGYDKVTLDEMIMLRDHGITPERIRKANDRAGTHLPLDLIKSLADGGGIR